MHSSGEGICDRNVINLSLSSAPSQDSVFNSLTWPPPLPPHPEESDSNKTYYFYINKFMVKGPESQRGRLSSGVSGARGWVSSLTFDYLHKEFKESFKESLMACRTKLALLSLVPKEASDT